MKCDKCTSLCPSASWRLWYLCISCYVRARLVAQFNHSHTVADIRLYIKSYPLLNIKADRKQCSSAYNICFCMYSNHANAVYRTLSETSARPQYASSNFALMTTFPNKELKQESQSIDDAKLQNAVIVQRLKWSLRPAAAVHNCQSSFCQEIYAQDVECVWWFCLTMRFVGLVHVKLLNYELCRFPVNKPCLQVSG